MPVNLENYMQAYNMLLHGCQIKWYISYRTRNELPRISVWGTRVRTVYLNESEFKQLLDREKIEECATEKTVHGRTNGSIISVTRFYKLKDK